MEMRMKSKKEWRANGGGTENDADERRRPPNSNQAKYIEEELNRRPAITGGRNLCQSIMRVRSDGRGKSVPPFARRSHRRLNLKNAPWHRRWRKVEVRLGHSPRQWVGIEGGVN